LKQKKRMKKARDKGGFKCEKKRGEARGVFAVRKKFYTRKQGH